MNILITEKDVRQLERIDQVPVGREMRYYYVARETKCMFHLVSRIGPLETLETPVVVESSVGWGEGWHGKCHPEHEGLRLQKVTLRRSVDASSQTQLASLIAESKNLPREEFRTPRWGGEKGRRR